MTMFSCAIAQLKGNGKLNCYIIHLIKIALVQTILYAFISGI